MLKAILASLLGRKDSQSRPCHSSARLQLETLEDRVLMASSLTQPILNSNPGAAKSIYLDFNGHTTTGTQWNRDHNGGKTIHSRAFSLDNDANSFSAAELERIEEIWKRVSEDYRPFNVNVTTQYPGADAFTAGSRAIRVVITTNFDDSALGGTGKKWYADSGGVAYLNSWSLKNGTPAWVFYNNLSSGGEKAVAEAVSHEAAHTLGLEHDGQGSTEYYKGHGSGVTGWAPIMGNSYSQALTQWSKGEYTNASNTQDDVAILADKLGVRSDDHSKSLNWATQLVASSSGNVSSSGIITTRTDVDVFRFSAVGGRVTFDIAPFEYGDGKANLDVIARLYNSSGKVVATSNPTDALYARFDVSLTAGTYYLEIDGVGKTGAYSDYGSLGQYTITGNVGSAPKITGARVLDYHFGPGLFTFTFDQAMNKSSFSTQDIISFTSPTGADLRQQITSITWVNNTLRINFTPPTQPGAYTMVIGPQILNLAGDAMDQNQNGINGEVADRFTISYTKPRV